MKRIVLYPMLGRLWTIVTLCVSNHDYLSSVDVASMSDFDSEDFDDAIGFDSDEGSVVELEWITWDDACAWESECVWGYSHAGGVTKGRISHGGLWISGVGCLLYWT